jgi:Uma2 family endonuclease
VRVANPADLAEFSEPEPDLMMLKRRPDDYARAHPQADDVLLLVEVADVSLDFDLGPKRDLYARYSVSEYWVVDTIHESVIVHQQPVDGTFREIDEYGLSDTISPRTFPEIQIAVRDLFGNGQRAAR